MPHALVVDDDIEAAESLRDLIVGQGLTVATARSLRDARRQISLQPPDIVLLDLRLPDGNGMDLLTEPGVLANAEVVLCTGHASIDTTIQALRLGAADYLVKPVNHTHLRGLLSRLTKPAVLRAEVESLSANLDATGHFGHLWGKSPPMQRLYEQISRVASTSVTVFVTGQSGTGKEVVAQTVHDLSRRRKHPFLAVNCGAISPNLIESEIFGHEKGSFTGAERQHQGFFERASGGTLFLDEITEMPLELQVKLLRVLETGRYMRVGSTLSQEADVRIIAATNRSPQLAVKEGRMREDLLYRLNVFPLAIPALRDRLSDVPLLANHFLRAICAQEGQERRFSSEALAQLTAYDWPGNVRELRNAVQRAYVMAGGDVIDGRWLPSAGNPSGSTPAAVAAKQGSSLPNSGRPQSAGWVGGTHAAATGVLPTAMPNALTNSMLGVSSTATITLPIGISAHHAMRAFTLATLRHCGHQKERTAAVLGISLKTLYNRLKDYASDDNGAPPEDEPRYGS
jgi:two-component system response regulator AtoC